MVFQVASRVIWQVMGVLFISFGVFGKFGAALTVMPDPIIGGLLMVASGAFDNSCGCLYELANILTYEWA